MSGTRRGHHHPGEMAHTVAHPNRPTAVIVEDELLIALALCEAIDDTGVAVTGMFSLGEDAAERVEALRPAVVVMDVRLAGRMDGIEVARIIRRGWRGPIVFHSAETGSSAVQAMAAIGDTVLVPKPASAATLAAMVAELARAEMALPRPGLAEPALRGAGD